MLDKAHWLARVQPLGPLRKKVEYQRVFTAAEAEKLRSGVWPQSMDDRWVVYLGGFSLDLWRSWTGNCIYSLPARSLVDGVEVGPLFINADREQYRSLGRLVDVQILEMMLKSVLRDGGI